MTLALNAVGQLVSAIRLQLIRRSPSPSSAGRWRPPGTSGALPSGQASVEALISERVRSISPDDPQRGRKAFRVFLESVLLSQFGDQLINDPGFYELLDELQCSMETDPSTSHLVADATRQLLAHP